MHCLSDSTLLAAEIASGDELSPPQLARKTGLNPSTITRWLLRGISDGRGGRIRLEAIRRGRVWLTSWGAYKRFLAAHPTNDVVEGPPSFRSSSERSRAGRDAADELKRKYRI